MEANETTPLYKNLYRSYQELKMNDKSKIGRTSAHPLRKTALQERLKDIVLLELRQDG
jgi:hypothetical protein